MFLLYIILKPIREGFDAMCDLSVVFEISWVNQELGEDIEIGMVFQ